MGSIVYDKYCSRLFKKILVVIVRASPPDSLIAFRTEITLYLYHPRGTSRCYPQRQPAPTTKKLNS